jgi:uncharacterized membrane protein YphA (DoxX/SURF4 family)
MVEASNIIAAMLTAIFVFASSIKLLGWQKTIFETQLRFFEKYGLSRSHMGATGVVELAGAVLLWVPEGARALGALLILATSLGAIFFHLRFDTWRDAMPAMVTATLSAMVLNWTAQEFLS